MAYKDALAEALGQPQDDLATTIGKLYDSDLAAQNQQRPDDTIIYNRPFNQTLQRVSGALTAARKKYDAWRNNQDSEASLRQGADEFADITRAIVEYKPSGHSSCIGDGLEQHLDAWMQARAVHLDLAHQDAIGFHAANMDLSEADIENRVVYRFEDLEKGEQRATSVEPNVVKAASNKPETQAERQRRQLMQFPTEAQSKHYFERNFHRLLHNPGPVQELRLTKKYQAGVLRVTSENTTMLGSKKEPAKIISRTKQGKVGNVDAESLKLFKSITGLRAENGKKPYSYDSIAMWHTNLEPEDIVSTLLHYYHDRATSNGGKAHNESITDADTFYEATPAGQSGYNVTPTNDTPGSPYDFHRLLHTKAQRQGLSEQVEDLARLNPPGLFECQKRRYIDGWLRGNKPRNSEEQAFQNVLDETRADLAHAYQAFLQNVIEPRDENLARSGDESPYTFADINTGFKGSLARRQRPLGESKKEYVNVPLELRVNDTDGPDRHGAGHRTSVETGDGVGRGRHTEYKQERLREARRLQEAGLYQAYQVVQDQLPTLSD